MLSLATLLVGVQTWGQGGNSEALFDIVVPAGGLNDDGTSAELPVQEGELLLSLVGNPIEMHAVIADENGGQTWSDQTPYRGFYMKPWRPGEFVWFDYTMRKWTVVDAEYNVLDTLTQSFDADDDYHDVQLLADNSYLVVLLEEVFMDLTDIGGVVNAKVLNPRLLHLDENENVLREWSGLDHMPLDPELDNVSNAIVDHLHWNAVQFDAHGGLLLSMRHRDQIVRLRPEDWSVHWKLGGADGDFAFDDPQWNGFEAQHDVHDLGEGHILLFDNGSFNQEGLLSRALEIELDTVAFTAENVWQFDHPDGVYAPSQGGVIRMDNGNTLISWGTAQAAQYGTRVTEVTADGEIAMEIRMSNGYNVYRARKYPPGMLSGCTDEAGANFSSSMWLLNEEECIYPVDNDGDGWTDVDGDCDDSNANIYPGAIETPEDGVDQDCDGVDTVLGCMDELATNFDAAATVPDNTCLYTLIAGVDMSNESLPGESLSLTKMLIADASDLSFQFAAEVEPEVIAWEACQFQVNLSAGDWICRFVRPDGIEETIVRTAFVGSETSTNLGMVCFDAETPCPGCMDPMDVAFNPWSTQNEGCLGWAVEGCTYPMAVNFQASANVDNGSCQFDSAAVCPGDLNMDGSVSVADVLALLVVFGSVCI